MSLNNGAANGQPQTGALFILCQTALTTIEAGENMRLLLARHSDTCIFNINDDVMFVAMHSNGNFATGRRVVTRVREDVRQYLLNAAGIEQCLWNWPSLLEAQLLLFGLKLWA